MKAISSIFKINRLMKKTLFSFVFFYNERYICYNFIVTSITCAASSPTSWKDVPLNLIGSTSSSKCALLGFLNTIAKDSVNSCTIWSELRNRMSSKPTVHLGYFERSIYCPIEEFVSFISHVPIQEYSQSSAR